MKNPTQDRHFHHRSRQSPGFEVALVFVLLFAIPPQSKLASASEQEEKPRHPFAVERNVIYDVAGETKLKADIYVPTEKPTGLRPGVLMIHGGAWMSGNKINVAVHAMKLARAGYVVMAINYRLAPKHKFPAQLEDCTAALQWLARNATKYEIDTHRMATYGYSAGGHLACLLGLQSVQIPIEYTESESVALSAIVAGGAPCEFRAIPERSITLSYWLGGTREDMPDQYRDASPTVFVSKDAPPVFFFHGDQDKLVPMRSPEALRRLLEEQKTTVEMKVVKDRGHMGTFFDGPAMNAARDFLDSNLKQSAGKKDTAETGTAEKDPARLPKSR